MSSRPAAAAELQTLVQAVAIGLFVLPLSGPWLTGAWVVMWAAVVLTVLTGVDYVVSAVRDSRGRPAGHWTHRALIADLTVRRQSVATAESLTAGLLAATLAGVAGASVALRGGLVTYIEDTKIALAGDVALSCSMRSGLSQLPTARAMAVGARQRCASTWGVGLTGVAGPERTAAIR